jgi:hypothetical protein
MNAEERGVVREGCNGKLAGCVLEMGRASHEIEGRLDKEKFKGGRVQLGRILDVQKIRAEKRHSCAEGRHKVVPKDTEVDKGTFKERIGRSDGGCGRGHGERWGKREGIVGVGRRQQENSNL